MGGSELWKSGLSSILCEGGSCSSETKHNRTAQRTKLFVSARLHELSQIRKLFWVRVPVKMLGLGIIIFFYDIQRYVSNNHVYGELSGNTN
jgi:hypothetical protein